MDLIEQFELLKKEKEHISKNYKASRFKKKMDLADYAKKFYPEYYIKVTNIIERFANQTEMDGHSDKLDRSKTKFYGLIDL